MLAKGLVGGAMAAQQVNIEALRADIMAMRDARLNQYRSGIQAGHQEFLSQQGQLEREARATEGAANRGNAVEVARIGAASRSKDHTNERLRAATDALKEINTEIKLLQSQPGAESDPAVADRIAELQQQKVSYHDYIQQALSKDGYVKSSPNTGKADPFGRGEAAGAKEDGKATTDKANKPSGLGRATAQQREEWRRQDDEKKRKQMDRFGATALPVDEEDDTFEP
jgi:hypothetical protein